MIDKYRNERVPLIRKKIGDGLYACEAGPLIVQVYPQYVRCTRHAETLHELRKRSQCGSITDGDNLMRVCFTCNNYVEDFPEIAWRAGLVMRHGETIEDLRRRWVSPETHDDWVRSKGVFLGDAS